MKRIAVDFETYYDTDFSLTKLPTDAYVKDPRYQTMGVTVREDDGMVQWFSGTEEETARFLSRFLWDEAAVVCHNTLFDGFIMTQRFGIRPKLWMDTKSMAYMLYPYLYSYSLANLAKHFGLQDKGSYVHDMRGRRRETLTKAELHEYGEYCKTDNILTCQLADLFLPRVPVLELKLIDMTVRMFTEPRLVGDMVKMEQLYAAELARKEKLMAVAGTDKDTIMSNERFALALRMELGYEPPTKVSPKTGKTAWAFAKTDKEFSALLEHPNPDVQALVAARLGVKTTIAETRALRMLETAKRGALPVYLNYWGAKTTGRYSGGNQINWQNLPARGPSAGLRDAIMAPEGHKVIVGDSSNIELRVAMAAAGQDDVVDLIANGQDLYCAFASKMFGRTITKADKKERMLGKIAMLSLQYGAGWRKFQEMVRIQANETLSDQAAEDIVRLYRRVHPKIVDFWERMEQIILPEIHNGCPNLLPVDSFGWCIATGEGFGVGGGPGVVYHDLRQEAGKDMYGRPSRQWIYEMGRETVKLYGGKVVENYSQHVARQIVMWQTARINERFPVSLSVHDEAVIVVKDSYVNEARAYMEECLSMAPPWCRDTIPLACETGVGQSYGSAK